MKKIIFIMALLFAAFLVSGYLDADSEVYLISTADELLLLEFWGIAVEETGIENETAVLDQLVIYVQDSGTMGHALLEFRGIKDGKWGSFQVRVDENGKVGWCESKLNGAFPESIHPLAVLKVVETVFSGIGSGTGNSSLNFNTPQDLLILAGSSAGSTKYGGQSGYAVYLFEKGKVVPLDLIEFESKDPWCQIMFAWSEACKATIKEEKNGLFGAGSVESMRNISWKNENNSKVGAPNNIIVFLEEDLDKALYVEYVEENSPG